MKKAVGDTMTSEEAALLMIGGAGSSGTAETTALKMPDVVEYSDALSSIYEYYNVDTDDAYSLRIRLNFSNKGTQNEMITGLYFYDKKGNQTGSISFNGFYIG